MEKNKVWSRKSKKRCGACPMNEEVVKEWADIKYTDNITTVYSSKKE